MPDGDVSLWVVATDDDKQIVALGRITAPLRTVWRRDTLCLDYGDVRMMVVQNGRYTRGIIIATSDDTREYAECFHFRFSDPDNIRKGQGMTVKDGVITMRSLDAE